MADNTRIYVNEEVFRNQIGALGDGLEQLGDILRDYEALKDQAKKVWGEEDINQRKAIEVCESAITLVREKQAETRNSKTQLENISSDAYKQQADYSEKLDKAKQTIDALRRS